MVRRSSFETTALEMPAGFGRIHHRANLARNGWPGPHLRTGDVTLVFTTDEICSNVKLLLWKQGVNRSCSKLFVSLQTASDFQAQENISAPVTSGSAPPGPCHSQKTLPGNHRYRFRTLLRACLRGKRSNPYLHHRQIELCDLPSIARPYRGTNRPQYYFRCSAQLSYSPLAGLVGFEPTTYGLCEGTLAFTTGKALTSVMYLSTTPHAGRSSQS